VPSFGRPVSLSRPPSSAAGRAADPAPRGVRVEGVIPGSPAAAAGIAAGDTILAVGDEPVGDLLDLHFLTSRRRFVLHWKRAGGEERRRLFRTEGEGPGIVPEPVRVRRCRNRCIFCFVHQLPKGFRGSLYVKDEDVRLSFLQGNYVTFSDVTAEELRKIVRYGLSPLYVSIHTADPRLRRIMLGNPRARDVTEVLGTLVSAGIVLHGQIVVCPGINDGEELRRTLLSLARFRPGLATVAVVPVGLTAHRRGLPPLRPVTRQEAHRTLAMLSSIRRLLGDRGGEPFVQAADEYYLLAGRRIPGRRAYGSFAQTENGVGLLRRFEDAAISLFRRRRWPKAERGATVVTGFSPRRQVSRFLEEFSRRAGAHFRPLPVANRLLGGSVTVTGLLGGADIAEALRRAGAERAYIPSVCLRDAGDLFLDGLSPQDVAREAGVEVRLFEATPAGFSDAVYRAEKLHYN
jgi:putative radical SAM enzyme (TIGR03279 family)